MSAIAAVRPAANRRARRAARPRPGRRDPRCSGQPLGAGNTPPPSLEDRTDTPPTTPSTPSFPRTPTPTTTTSGPCPVSYTHLRAHETDSYLVCRLLLEKKKK